jgi:hypothetical protein
MNEGDTVAFFVGFILILYVVMICLIMWDKDED